MSNFTAFSVFEATSHKCHLAETIAEFLLHLKVVTICQNLPGFTNCPTKPCQEHPCARDVVHYAAILHFFFHVVWVYELASSQSMAGDGAIDIDLYATVDEFEPEVAGQVR